MSEPSTSSPLPMIAAALHRERQRAGLSLSELARRAGLAKSTLSQLENGIGNPSIESLWAIALALGVPFSRLIDPPQIPVQVIRASEGLVTHSDGAAYEAVLLATCPPGARRDLYRVHFEPGRIKHSEAHNPGTLEHLIVQRGAARVGPQEACIELEAGDYAVYPGDVPHSYEALVPDTWVTMVLELN